MFEKGIQKSKIVRRLFEPVKTPNLKQILEGTHRKKWGLVLEGGAMRSIFTAGVLDAIHISSHKKFDFIIGVSAGAACGISFAANQRGRMQHVFMNYLSDRRFLDFSRIFDGKRSILDLSFAVRKICTTLMPLDMTSLSKNPTKLYATLTNAENGMEHFQKITQENVVDSLTASCNIPLLTRGSVEVDGCHYVDGGVVAPLPLKEAIKHKPDGIVVVMTRPFGFRDKPRRIVTSLLNRINTKFQALEEFIFNETEIYNHQKAFVEKFSSPEIDVILVCPPDDFGVEMLTRDRGPLMRGYAQGFEAGIGLEKKLKDKGFY